MVTAKKEEKELKMIHWVERFPISNSGQHSEAYLNNFMQIFFEWATSYFGMKIEREEKNTTFTYRWLSQTCLTNFKAHCHSKSFLCSFEWSQDGWSLIETILGQFAIRKKEKILKKFI